MNNHERLTRSIAEEMANVCWHHYMGTPLSLTTPKHQQRQIEIKMPYARIAVKHMAYEARTVWMALSQKTWEQAHEECEKYLTAIGLIQPTGKEAAEDGNH